MGDERGIDGIGKDHRIQAGLLEHVDILALLLFIGHIEHLVFMALFFIGIQAVLQGQIFAVQVFKDDIIVHLFCKLLIL